MHDTDMQVQRTIDIFDGTIWHTNEGGSVMPLERSTALIPSHGFSRVTASAVAKARLLKVYRANRNVFA